MKAGSYFFIFFALILQLVGLIWYSQFSYGLFFGVEFLLILFLMLLSLLALLTLGYDTKLPVFLLLVFFVIALFDTLIFYYVFNSARLFAVMIIVGALGIIVSLNLFDKVSQKKLQERIKEVEVYEAPKKAKKTTKKKTAKRKTAKKRKTRKKK